MFDGLKRLLSGPSAPAATLIDALTPLKAADPALHDRAVAYVHAGTGPELLYELEQGKQAQLDELLIAPGRLKSWSWPSEAIKGKLKSLGLDKDKVERARNLFYASAATPAQFVRFGRLLAALSLDVNRGSAGVPTWLTALLNDVANTFPDGTWTEAIIAKRLRQWTPEFVESLLAEAETPDADRVPITLAVLLQQCDDLYGNRFAPHQLPGLNAYLLANGAALTPALVSGLVAASRTDVAERAESNPALAEALAPAIAAGCTDPAKGVRTAALRTLAKLPEQTRGRVLPPVLASVLASRAGDLVELLGRDDAGAALLQAAVEGGAKLTALVEQASQRREAIAIEVPDEALELPPFEPIIETDNGEAIKAELRRKLAAEIARGEGSDNKWVKKNAAKARSISEADLDGFVAAAAGRATRTKLLTEYNLWWLADAATSLNLIQVLRLARIENSRYVSGRVRLRADNDTDLRVIADAAARAGVDLDPSALANGAISPEASWPYMAEHADVLMRWLSGSASDVTTALQVLAHFPKLPQPLVPKLAAVALSDSKTNRPLAQAGLASHPAARALAEQGLTNSKSEIRVAAAGWLGGLGDPAGVPALRTALKKESRELVRAALLTALETLGDDISGDLAPAVLLAEATKGLKAKQPASMAWLNLELIPAARWADGTPVEPAILRWWHVLAVKSKEPDGSGLLDRYLSLLHPDDAAAIGRFALTSWIAHDTRHPSEADCRAHAAVIGPHRWQQNQDWLARTRQNPNAASWLQSVEEEAAKSVEQLTAESYAEHQAIYLGSAAADKGLLALTTRMPGIELAGAVQSYIRNHGGRRAQVEYLVNALYANGEPAATQLLLSISRRFKQATVQAKALEFVERLAEARGWTPDELADRTIPTAGFADDRLLHLDFGPREFIGRVNAKAGIELSDASGKVIKALPSPRSDDDEELVATAKKQLTASRKELKAVLDQQSARLYEAMCSQRSWAAADWQQFLAGHPLVSRLVAGLIWVESADAGRRLFRPTEDGELIGTDDEPITLAPDARVSLAHRVLLSEDELAEWRTHLADYGVTVLFDQLGATLPEVPANATELSDLKGHLTDTFSFRGVAGKRGYSRGQAEDGGWFSEYSKPFGSLGLTAVLEFTGSFVPEENITCATGSLSFRRRNRAVPLAEVPPVLLAECYADYAALAALGPFDPEWEKKSAY